MKTAYEQQYEQFTISMILHQETSKAKQVNHLVTFHQHASQYYDELCDAIYALSIGRKNDYLCISPCGKPFFSSYGSTGEGYILCSPFEIPTFEEDLDTQLEFILGRLRDISWPAYTHK